MEYLTAQLCKDQQGCHGSWDLRQKNRDIRNLKDELNKTFTAEMVEDGKKTSFGKRRRDYDKENNGCEANSKERRSI